MVALRSLAEISARNFACHTLALRPSVVRSFPFLPFLMLPCEYGPECDSDDSGCGCGCLQLAPVLLRRRDRPTADAAAAVAEKSVLSI